MGTGSAMSRPEGEVLGFGSVFRVTAPGDDSWLADGVGEGLAGSGFCSLVSRLPPPPHTGWVAEGEEVSTILIGARRRGSQKGVAHDAKSIMPPPKRCRM